MTSLSVEKEERWCWGKELTSTRDQRGRLKKNDRLGGREGRKMVLGKGVDEHSRSARAIKKKLTALAVEKEEKWCWGKELNPRPPDYKARLHEVLLVF